MRVRAIRLHRAPPPRTTLPKLEPRPTRCPYPTRPNRNAEVDFKGETRSNATHASTTDPDAQLYKKSPGTGAMLCFMGHALMENRRGLIVQGDLTQVDGQAERRAAPVSTAETKPATGRRKTRPVAGVGRHGTCACQIAGACHGALARRAKSLSRDQALGGAFRARLWAILRRNEVFAARTA